jgi:hypothetical protein
MRSQVDTICSVDTHAWDTYVGQCAQATHYHLSAWGRIIACVYGYPCLYITVWDGEALCGIVPVVIIGGLFRRKRFVSMPYLDYGGICADTPEIAQHLYRAIQRAITGQRAGLLDLRQRGAIALPLTPYGDKVTMVLRLEPEPEHMWKAFGAKLRNQIRKAEKAHLQIQWAGIEGLQDFYHVYVHNMRDLGSPPHSLRSC